MSAALIIFFTLAITSGTLSLSEGDTADTTHFWTGLCPPEKVALNDPSQGCFDEHGPSVGCRRQQELCDTNQSIAEQTSVTNQDACQEHTWVWKCSTVFFRRCTESLWCHPSALCGQGSCECPANSTFEGDECTCVKGYYVDKDFNCLPVSPECAEREIQPPTKTSDRVCEPKPDVTSPPATSSPPGTDTPTESTLLPTIIGVVIAVCVLIIVIVVVVRAKKRPSRVSAA